MKTNAAGLHIINKYGEKYWVVDSVEEAEKIVSFMVCVRLTPNQFSAMVSFVIGLGASGFAKSTVLKHLNNAPDDREAMFKAASELLLYREPINGNRKDAAVFKERRKLEHKLFLTPELIGGKDCGVSYA